MTISARLYQLHQLLQYQVITDSKPVACLLLSLASVYPSSQQVRSSVIITTFLWLALKVALDMMSRLGTATQEIIEILLAQGKVITALNYGQYGHPEVRLIRLILFSQWVPTEERTLPLPGSFWRQQRPPGTRWSSSMSTPSLRSETCDWEAAKASAPVTSARTLLANTMRCF